MPSGNYPVQVTQAKFANHQKLSETGYLQLGLRNAGSKTIPNLTVTINTVEQGQPNVKSPAYSTGSGQGSFNVRIDDPHLAFPFRPVWILEEHYPTVIKPGQSIKGQLAKTPTSSAASAATDTFQFGEVKPNDSKDIAWRVTPVRTGTFTVRYAVSASLTGVTRQAMSLLSFGFTAPNWKVSVAADAALEVGVLASCPLSGWPGFMTLG